ncbi:transcriptional repressor [Dyadobacter frigoris]|uniref:Ferric uptake regulator family protein n=1 Tax=Dyadobacter frigoris TaxID=2576211 RepID=A0A4U6CR48_9BACT|nr:transcriptional repressor [Dyadobacter frigoris]TKT85941.1 hypothetical protein FDK13_33085 [Dyadobacter frigoris]GLU57145.1 hypothetical protein Dfri01_66060 [Dyadobacter frigoris]
MSIEEQILLYFDENNLRRSSKKILVAKYLTAYQTEVAAETLWIMIRQKRMNISIASVYQALKWLVDLGYATKILKGRKTLYQIKETTPLSN